MRLECFELTSKVSPLQGAPQQDLYNLDIHRLCLCPPSNDACPTAVSCGLQCSTLETAKQVQSFTNYMENLNLKS